MTKRETVPTDLLDAEKKHSRLKTMLLADHVEWTGEEMCIALLVKTRSFLSLCKYLEQASTKFSVPKIVPPSNYKIDFISN